MKTLGKQARDFREAKKWNTAQMAAAVRTSRQNIESLEAHGNRIPKYIGDLAHVMGTTVDAMLHLADMRETPPLAAWPFAVDLYARFNELSDKDKGYVEGRLSAAIEQCEAAAGTNVDAGQLGHATPAKSPNPATETSRYPEHPNSSVKTPRVAAVPLPTVTPGGMFGPEVGVKRAGSSNRKTGRR